MVIEETEARLQKLRDTYAEMKMGMQYYLTKKKFEYAILFDTYAEMKVGMQYYLTKKKMGMQ